MHHYAYAIFPACMLDDIQHAMQHSLLCITSRSSCMIWAKLQDQEETLELDAVVDSISSPQQLFDVLNEQLTMVQDLSEEIRDKGIALRHSEEAR